jgi:hypothetical protein
MSFPDGCALPICGLFVLLVVSVIAIDKIAKFANPISRVDRLDFGIVKMSICVKSVHARVEWALLKIGFNLSACLGVLAVRICPKKTLHQDAFRRERELRKLL